VVWVGTAAGLARFDGVSWFTYTSQNGVPVDHVNDLAISPRGGIWVGSWESGLSYYDFSVKAWNNYWGEGSPNNFSRNGSVGAIAPMSDGSVWIGTAVVGVFHLIPGMLSGGKNTWTRYGTIEARALHVANDNSIWVAGEKGIARFDPIIEKWTVYHHTTDNFTAIDQATDGSLWIGTWDDGVRHLIPAKNGGNDIWETYTSNGHKLRFFKQLEF